MSVQQSIENLLNQALSPSHLEVINESHQHAGHAHGSTDSHFRVVIACDKFDGIRQVKRHQQIYSILDELMDNPIHALAINSFSTAEWQDK
jgi:BolA protein